jgi:hypothetical protein
MKRLCKFMIPALLVAAVPAVALAQQARLSCPSGTVQAGGAKSQLEADACMARDGTFHGPYVVYHANGVKQAEGQWEKGFRTGTWTYFDKNGVKTGETQFHRDNYHGRRIELHPNGRVAVEESYVKGLREGQVRHFDTTGEVVRVVEYRANRLVTQR